jgi:hypothetical protein
MQILFLLLLITFHLRLLVPRFDGDAPAPVAPLRFFPLPTLLAPPPPFLLAAAAVGAGEAWFADGALLLLPSLLLPARLTPNVSKSARANVLHRNAGTPNSWHQKHNEKTENNAKC